LGPRERQKWEIEKKNRTGGRARAFSLSRLHDHTQLDAPQSVGPLWTVASLSQRYLPDNTQHSQKRDAHAFGKIGTHNPSKRAAADSRLKPYGHRNRSFVTIFIPNFIWVIKLKKNDTDGACILCGKRKKQ
jgi:hypothetical protein